MGFFPLPAATTLCQRNHSEEYPKPSPTSRGGATKQPETLARGEVSRGGGRGRIARASFALSPQRDSLSLSLSLKRERDLFPSGKIQTQRNCLIRNGGSVVPRIRCCLGLAGFASAAGTPQKDGPKAIKQREGSWYTQVSKEPAIV